MSFQPIPNGAEFVVRGSVEGQQICNTFYATKAGAWDVTELAAACSALGVIWRDHVLSHLGSSYTFVGVHARDLRTAIGVQADFSGASAPGTAAGQTLPNNVALAIKRTSSLAGRGARGRVYIGGLTDGSLTGTNEVNVGVANALAAALNLIQGAWEAIDWTEVIVHRVAAGVPLSSAVVYTLVEYVVYDLVLDSMRRRLPKRGSS